MYPGEMDGDRGWSPWTSCGRTLSTKDQLKARYRGCAGDKFDKRECTVTTEISTKANIPGIPSVYAFIDGPLVMVSAYYTSTWYPNAPSHSKL